MIARSCAANKHASGHREEHGFVSIAFLETPARENLAEDTVDT